MPGDQTEVSRGHSRCRRRCRSTSAGNEPRWNRRGSLTSPKDRTQSRETDPMSSRDTLNQSRGVAARRVVEPSGPESHLLERILTRENMRAAWKRVAANKGVAGVDKMPIDDFVRYAREHWRQIHQSLLAGTYQPSPVLRIEIPKSTGGKRPLGIPTVLDRVIQQAIAQMLVPIFDPGFSEHSYVRRIPIRRGHGPGQVLRSGQP